jgi:D-glycero-D-manno-heptose 1,7-bisphosphate phosphatase
MKSLSPALFLDRDGVLNREIGYLFRPEQVEFMPGIFDLCRFAQARGYKLLVITNQAGIARGLYSEEDFHFLMRWMLDRFEQQQVHLDGYYYCPHHPEHGTGQYRKDCPDRKPGPGMILTAAAQHGIDLPASLLLGDRCSDLQAGAAAGVGRLVLLAGLEQQPCQLSPPYVTVRTLSDVVDILQAPLVAK